MTSGQQRRGLFERIAPWLCDADRTEEDAGPWMQVGDSLVPLVASDRPLTHWEIGASGVSVWQLERALEME
jgi:hypothetical protein